MKKWNFLVARESRHLCGVIIMDRLIRKLFEELDHIFLTITPAAPWEKPGKGEFYVPFCAYLAKKRYWFCIPLMFPTILLFLYPIAWLNYKLIKRKIQKSKPEFLLNHGDNHINAIIARCGKELGIPVITIIHTAFWIYLRSEVKWEWLYKFLLNCQIKNSEYVSLNSDAVIMLSKWQQQKYLELIPNAVNAPIHLLSNVIDEDILLDDDETTKATFLKEVKEILPFFGINPIIALIGRIEEVKNLQFMIDVMDIYEKKRRDLDSNKYEPIPHVVFIGEGPYQKTLEKLAYERGISYLFHFVGKKDYIWTRRFMRWATDLLCITSLSETFGLTLIESMLEGCPALVTEGSALEENCLHKEDILPPDPEAWVKAIRPYVTDHQYRDSIGQQLASQARTINNNGVYTDKLLTIIESAIKHSKNN